MIDKTLKWRDFVIAIAVAVTVIVSSPAYTQDSESDEVISEPLGGAHRDPEAIALDIKHAIIKNLRIFENSSKEEIYDQRKSRFLKIGREQGFSTSTDSTDGGLLYKQPSLQKVKSHITENKFIYLGLSLILIVGLISIIY